MNFRNIFRTLIVSGVLTVLLENISLAQAEKNKIRKFDCTGVIYMDGYAFFQGKELDQFQFSDTVKETEKSMIITSCYHASSDTQKKCKDHKIDTATVTKSGGKKYYEIKTMFDFQLLPSLKFVERIETGGTLYGKCKESKSSE